MGILLDEMKLRHLASLLNPILDVNFPEHKNLVILAPRERDKLRMEIAVLFFDHLAKRVYGMLPLTMFSLSSSSAM